MSEWVNCLKCGTLMENLCACPKCEPCDHDWEFVDESFAHEFGTEIVHRWECSKCGESTSKCPVDHDPDPPDDEC